jgi:hypothetical protein
MSSERQRQANQQNARKSTGPKTNEGKQNSRRNALKHGLSGSGTVLTRSDDRIYRKTLNAWREHLQPIDVLEDCLVARAALAKVRLRRCLKKDLADLSRRKRRATKRWDVRQEKAVDLHAELFETDPEKAVAELESNSAGCDWLIDRWRELAAALEAPGFWDATQARVAIQMLGKDPETTPMDDSSISRVRLAILAISPKLDPDAADAFFEESTSHLDPNARIEALSRRLPDPDTGRAMLGDIIEQETARLEPMSQQLWDDQDAPERQEAEDISLVDTSPEGARALRYESAIEMSLHRNVNQLIRLRKVESEQQTLDRLSKMGIDHGRRFDGTNWEYVRDEAKARKREEAERRDFERNATEVSYNASLVDPQPAPKLLSQDQYDEFQRKRAEDRAAYAAAPGGSGQPTAGSASVESRLRNEANSSESTQYEETAYGDRAPGSPSVDGGRSEAAQRVGTEVGAPVTATTRAGESQRPGEEAQKGVASASAAVAAPVRNEAGPVERNGYANEVCADPEGATPAPSDGPSPRSHAASGLPQAPSSNSEAIRIVAVVRST